MYLKKLTVHGFKSFANRTSFDFGPGITAVVGPNGSGKSNVADAIRWVLGEQSSRLLRARRKEDVIFAGGGDRSPVGMAEVVLTLDNSDHWLPLDFVEIELGRRLYRDGDTEYLLNGSRVRLRDLTDLLTKGEVGQNSYTIMGQGLVDEVLLMTAADRRVFVDEAADVKRYRVRIQEAQDRLGSTRSNLDQVRLILGELEPRLTQLRRQAERAAQQAVLSDELIALLRDYYGQMWADTQNNLVGVQASLDQRTAENEAAGARVSSTREQLAALSEEIQKRRDALARRESHDSDIDLKIEMVERALALDAERREMAIARSAELQEEIAAMEAELEEMSSEESPDEATAGDAEDRIAAAKEELSQRRRTLDDIEDRLGDARVALSDLTTRADFERETIASLEREASASRSRLAELEREQTANEIRRQDLLKELAAYGDRYAGAREAIQEAEAAVDATRLTAEQARERLVREQQEFRDNSTSRNPALRELDHLEGRLEALQRIQAEYLGIPVGTRRTLELGGAIDVETELDQAELAGVVGLLANQIKVSPGLEAPINAALENRVHAIVVEKEEHALRAIARLQSERGGRVMMLPLESVRHIYPLNLSRERGVVGVASKLVRCDKRFRPLVDTLLGRVIIVEDREAGLKMVRRGLGLVVTVDGTLLEPNGVITGGATGAEEGPFLRHQELEELPDRIRELRERTGSKPRKDPETEQAIEEAVKEAKQADQQYEHMLNRIEESRTTLERERERLHRIRRDLDTAHRHLAENARALEVCASTIATSESAAAEPADKDELRGLIAAADSELEAATAARSQALEAFSDANADVAALEGEQQADETLRLQRERSQQRLVSQLAARREQTERLEAEAATISSRITSQEEEHETLIAARASETDDSAPDRDELTRLESHERQVNDELNEAQADLLRLEKLRLDLEAEVARLTEHLELLREEMAREGLAPDHAGCVVPMEDVPNTTSAPIQGGAELDLSEAKSRIEELRRKIRKLGPVNEEAPEDFRETEKRHEFLSGQLNDLTEAEEQLQVVIAELNEEIRIRFSAAFDKVDAAFGEYFTAFFGGGTARLVLTERDNLAETGIDIEAQPPGKRLNSLSLLSGGERSLTAVALLFALLTVNPAPFCVLDEVDAALDEANVARFTNALTELSGKTQFLVVTHNRRTIEQTNAVYGVSMGSDSVSKVLSVNLDELPDNVADR